jgi:amidase
VIAPCVAWPHRIDIGKDVPFYEEPACSFGEPLMDLASGTFPTGLIQDPDIDLPVKDFVPRSNIDGPLQEMCKYLVIHPVLAKADSLDGNPEKWRSAPIGLQLTARKLEDEKVVDMLYRIRDALALMK